jgi:hypothetical protein
MQMMSQNHDIQGCRAEKAQAAKHANTLTALPFDRHDSKALHMLCYGCHGPSGCVWFSINVDL